MSQVIHRWRRIAAYARCGDGSGRVLLVRASAISANAGRWFLPGGGVDHGEHPVQAVVREVAEETGLQVTVTGLDRVITDVERLPDGTLRHQDRLIFDVALAGGALRAEVGGSTDRVTWVAPTDLSRLPLMPHVARVLGVARGPGEQPMRAGPAGPEGAGPAGPEGAGPAGPESAVPANAVLVDAGPADAGDGTLRFQRFAAYGLVRDPADR
ncbi:MAG: NUDIX hydrolase, partial [Micromonosporaceae bacterium]